jgi:hypothetical protein
MVIGAHPLQTGSQTERLLDWDDAAARFVTACLQNIPGMRHPAAGGLASWNSRPETEQARPFGRACRQAEE